MTCCGGRAGTGQDGGRGGQRPLLSTAERIVNELHGRGSDSVYTYVSHQLTAGSRVEILSANSHGATTAINLTGNELANTSDRQCRRQHARRQRRRRLRCTASAATTSIMSTCRRPGDRGRGRRQRPRLRQRELHAARRPAVEILSTASHGATDGDRPDRQRDRPTASIGNAGANMLDGKGGND